MKKDAEGKLVTGLMSGTSLDGIDAALVKIMPDLSCQFIDGLVYEYSPEMKQKIRTLFNKKISVKDLCEMNFLIGEYFAKAVLKLEEKTKLKADLIGSHGVTLYHNPIKDVFENMPLRSTLQIGEGAVIAERTNTTTVYDFRPADIAAGGEGAPLVPFFDKIIFGNSNINRAIQNLGGIGNVTVLSKDCETFAFDTGPANMLIDNLMQKLFNKPYDKDGCVAARGNVNHALLKQLMDEPYLKLTPPKSTGRELFGDSYADKILQQASSLNKEDIIATVTEFTVQSIKDAYEKFVFPKTTIQELILGGGGAYNTTIKQNLQKAFGEKLCVKTHADYNISDKYKEAMAFALLAYCTYYNIPNNVKTATGAVKTVILGKIIYKNVL